MKTRIVFFLAFFFCFLNGKSEEGNRQPVRVILDQVEAADGYISSSLVVQKDIPGTVDVEVYFTDLVNAFVKQGDYYSTSVHKPGVILQVPPIEPRLPYRCSFTYKFAHLDPKAKPDTLFLYRLPFESAAMIRFADRPEEPVERYVTVRDGNVYFADLKAGEKIFPARTGIVTKIVTLETSRIVIEHPDGTFSEYGGLDNGTVAVEPGDIVYPDSVLGAVGAAEGGSGLSFSNYYYVKTGRGSVDQDPRYERIGLTSRFMTKEKRNIVLEDGKEYTPTVDQSLIELEKTAYNSKGEPARYRK